MKNISVIGAGTMGNGIAHVFAQNGYQVNLIDVSLEALEKAVKTISRNLDRMVAKEKITELQKKNTLNNLTTISEVLAVILSKPINLAIDLLLIFKFFFFSCISSLLEFSIVVLSTSSKLGFISSRLISGEEIILSCA